MKNTEILPDKNRKANKKLLLVGMIALLLGGSFLLWKNFIPLFEGEKLSVLISGNNILKEEEIREIISLIISDHDTGISLSEFEDSISLNPWIKSVSVTKISPNKIKVHIQEKQPACILSEEGELSILDKEALYISEEILMKSNNFNFRPPLISANNKTGNNMKQIKNICKLYSKYKKKYDFLWQRIDEIVISDTKKTFIYSFPLKSKMIIGESISESTLKKIWGVYFYLEKLKAGWHQKNQNLFPVIEITGNGAIINYHTI